MKKSLSAMALSLLLAAPVANAQTLNESFEGTAVPPEGWTVRSSSTNWTWTAEKYTKFSNYVKGYTDGGLQAMKSTTGRSASNIAAPDSWLITPQVAVAEGDYLSFMVGWNASFNGAANVAESGRTHFEVLVSATDTAAASFTDTLYAVVPVNLSNWHAMSLSLAKYAGKQVYIAFHDHGDTPTSPFSSNALYIDDVKVGADKAPDLTVEEMTSPVAGYYDTQNVTLKVHNYGSEVSAFNIGYKVDDGEAVTEAVNQAIGTDGCLTLSFATPATLSRAKHTIQTWVSAEGDKVSGNDTLATSVTIDPTLPFPYKMTSADIDSLWRSTAKRKQMSVVYGWSLASAEEAWSYLEYATVKSRLESYWIEMPEGPTQFKFDYKTLVAAGLNLAVTTADGDTAAVYTAALPAASDYSTASISMSLPAGVYKMAVTVDSPYDGQLLLKNVEIKTLEGDDVAMDEITEPLLVSVVEGTKVSFSGKVSNAGSKTQTSIPVKLVYDGVVVASETIDTLLAPGESVAHTFGYTATATEGKHVFSMIAALEGDANAANDTISDTLDVYKAMAFPFVESFENTATSDRWIRVNPGDNVIVCTIGEVGKYGVNYAKDGHRAAYVNSLANTEHDNWLISPAIKIDAATPARLSYYYTTTMKATNATDEAYVEAYLVKEPETLYNFGIYNESTLIAADTITDDNVLTYRQGYAYKEIAEPGTYYLAFHNTGKGHDLIIDDVRLDSDNDVAVTAASQTATSGFGLNADTISVTVANHGAADVKSIELKYYVNDELTATETYQPATAMKPGETVDYTFQQKLDVSTPGDYTVKVEATAEGDTLDFNNAWTLTTISSYETAALPYSDDLDSEESQAYWTADGNWAVSGTLTANNSAYNGQGAIVHSGKAADALGDWAFSGCIDIPEGTHELSFFFRTALNGKSASSYAQNFEVYLGSKADSASMTKLVYKSDADVIVSDRRYKKVIATFDNEAGLYYIGIKCNSTTRAGKLFIDQLAIDEPATAELSLGEYTADFSEWYQYDPSSQFKQWTVADSVEGYYTTTRAITSWNTPTELPGVLVSPAFAGKAGDVIDATLDYSMTFDNGSQLSDEEKAKMKMTLVVAQVNIPDSFSTVIVAGDDTTGVKATATGKYTLPADGIYYYGVKAEGAEKSIKDDVVATYNLYTVVLNGPDIVTAISQAEAKAMAEVEVYSIDGMSLGRFDSLDAARKAIGKSGLYIMKSGQKTFKTVIRK